MEITLNLPDDVAAQLQAEATALGIGTKRFAESVIRSYVGQEAVGHTGRWESTTVTASEKVNVELTALHKRSLREALRVYTMASHELPLEEAHSEDVVDDKALAGFLENAIRCSLLRWQLEVIALPVREAFRASGMTEEELVKFLEDEKHAMRRGE
jgi:hypothetical protein